MNDRRNTWIQWCISLFLILFLGYNYFTKEYEFYRNAILILQIGMWIVLSIQLLIRKDK
jgi:hypothetical protein